jgi:hypothetical protein
MNYLLFDSCVSFLVLAMEGVLLPILCRLIIFSRMPVGKDESGKPEFQTLYDALIQRYETVGVMLLISIFCHNDMNEKVLQDQSDVA